MKAHLIPIKRLIATRGLASAIAIAPALAVSLSGAPDSFLAAPGCAPSQVTNMSTGQCAPVPTPGAGALSETDLSQPGAGYVAPLPGFNGSPSEQDVTACHNRGGDNNNCIANGFYGSHEIPKPSSPVTSSP
jgi:hypothetical protein